MRFKKEIILSATLLIICMMCAFITIPSVELKNESGEIIDLSYKSAIYNDDKLTIAVEYDSYGEGFEIAKDIVVASDDAFSEKIPLKKVTTENGKYIYEFDVSKNEVMDDIYIEPPVLYVPITIEKEFVPVQNLTDVNAKEQSEKNNIGLESNIEGLFSVTDYKIVKVTENTYQVVTYIHPNSKRLPRFPELNMGNKVYGGISCLSFDENGIIVAGEFIFSVRAENEEEVVNNMKTAFITVQNALEIVVVDDCEISTAKKMNVVIQK